MTSKEIPGMLFEEIATGACVGKNDPALAQPRKQRQPRAPKTVDQLAAAVVKAIKEQSKRTPEPTHPEQQPETEQPRKKTCSKPRHQQPSTASPAVLEVPPAADCEPASEHVPPPQHPRKKLRSQAFACGVSPAPAALAEMTTPAAKATDEAQKAATFATPERQLLPEGGTPPTHSGARFSAHGSAHIPALESEAATPARQLLPGGTPPTPAPAASASPLQPTLGRGEPKVDAGVVTPPRLAFSNGYMLFRSEWTGEGNVAEAWHRLAPEVQHQYRTRCKDMKASCTPTSTDKASKQTYSETRSSRQMCRPLVHFARPPAPADLFARVLSETARAHTNMN